MSRFIKPTKYLKISNQPNAQKAFTLARGVYQKNLALGLESHVGANLKGKAKQYSGSYYRSRQSFYKKLREAGVKFEFLMVDKIKVLHIV